MTLTAILAGYAADLFAGHSVIVSNNDLDLLATHYTENAGPDADRWFRELVTTPNPERLGFRDAYVANLRDREPELMVLLRKGLGVGLTAEEVERLRSYKAALKLPKGVEVEDLVVRPSTPTGMFSVFLRLMRDVTRIEHDDRRAVVYRNVLGHWTVDYEDSPGRPCDSSCSMAWTESIALLTARAFVLAPRVPDEDVTELVLHDLKNATFADLMRTIKPAKGLTKPRAALLLKLDGVRLEYVSNVLLYAGLFKRWPRPDHKTLLSLVLAGYVRVFKVYGALPMAHAIHGASTEAHYRLEVRKPSEAK